MQSKSSGKFGQIVGRVIILQVLFMAFTILGLGILGFLPALLAVMAVARQFLRETAEPSITKMFWRFYKEMFAKGNLFGLPLIVGAVLLLINIYHFQQVDGALSQLLIYGSYFLEAIILILFIQGLPSLVHMEISIIHLIRGAFLITLIRPFHTVAVAAMLIGIGWIAYKISLILAVLLIAPVAYLWMRIALNAFLGFVTEKEG
ncbi:hypothetical protein J14TS2_10780 [Bacillus sp. J14TS2]|uniref:YesL family protein n=1 Tax=Bacillus sp. J14TS2 TaxID=2807188 RepID=UPI001B2122D8|nr:DUF624 domain-containing protein [Bacillus sp. J14TS2]GIN70603.1 hypothetical protein J14TS2_10780 [Bacillus sp. J14TS2]